MTRTLRHLLLLPLALGCGSSSTAIDDRHPDRPRSAAPGELPLAPVATSNATAPALPTIPPAPPLDPGSPCVAMAKQHATVGTAAARIELALRDACLGSAWTPVQIGCFTNAKTVEAGERCIVKLPPAQRQALGERIVGLRRIEERRKRKLDCASIVKYPEVWYDTSRIKDASERAFVAGLVAPFVALNPCEYVPDIAKHRDCFARAKSADDEAACLEDGVVEEVASTFERFRKEIVAAHKQPPTCKQTAALYHANQWWWDDKSGMLHGAGGRVDDSQVQPNRMAQLSRLQQVQLIDTARADVASACERERWSTWVRACIAAAWTERHQAACLVAIDGKHHRGRRFTAPPLEHVAARVDVCDKYLGAARALVACPPSDQIDAAIADAARWAAGHVRASEPAVEPGWCAVLHRDLAEDARSCIK